VVYSINRREMYIREDKMIQKSAIFLAVLIMFTLTGCPEIVNTPFSYDPDPVDPSVVLPDPDEDLYIVANIDGKIYGVHSSDPNTFTTLATDVSTGENFSEIRLSPDKKHLLYSRVNDNLPQIDLVLLDISITDAEPIVIANNIKSNESEFISDTEIFYTNGTIYVYTIDGFPPYSLVPVVANRCKHWAQLSPDSNRIVFKDQSYVEDEGFHSVSLVVFGEETQDFIKITN